MYRNVFGKISDISSRSTKFANEIIVFRLETSSFTVNEIYPRQETEVVCDALGTFNVDLWCTAGYIETVYQCRLLGDRFIFALPAGTEPIDLARLRLTQLIKEGKVVDETVTPTPIIDQYVVRLQATQNQTRFQLPALPKRPDFLQFYINGIKLVYPRDYVIDGTAVTLTFPEYQLDPTDSIEIYFD